MKELRGLPVAQSIREEIRAGVARLVAGGLQPRLAVFLVGDDPGSVWYAESKAKLRRDLGIVVDIKRFAGNASATEIGSAIREESSQQATHGILVELPLPASLDKSHVLEAIDPLKDVDCVTLHNRGLLFSGLEQQALLPATPLACVRLLEACGEELEGSKVTLVGRGETVGRPLAMMLIKRNATVTVCHTRTANLDEECRRADILIAAAGKPGLITPAMVSPPMVVVDVGVAQQPDGSYVGDVDYAEVSKIVRAITPVPGGVGTLTTTMVLSNVMRAIELQNASRSCT